MTTDRLLSCIETIRNNILDMGCDVEEIIVTLSTGKEIHITLDDIDDEFSEDLFLTFCNWNLFESPEIWYHTFSDGKQVTRTIAAEHIVMIDVIYAREDSDTVSK